MGLGERDGGNGGVWGHRKGQIWNQQKARFFVVKVVFPLDHGSRICKWTVLVRTVKLLNWHRGASTPLLSGYNQEIREGKKREFGEDNSIVVLVEFPGPQWWFQNRRIPTGRPK